MKKKFCKKISGKFLTFSAAFSLSLIIFGSIAAVILFSSAPALTSTLSGTSSQQKDKTAGSVIFPSSYGFTMLISVRQSSGSEPCCLMLYRLDTSKNTTTLTPIPLNLETDSKKPVSISEYLKENGPGKTAGELSDIMSTKIKFTCDISADNFTKIFDILGGLYYSVPQDIPVCSTQGNNFTITKSGRQYLSGDKIYAMISFSGYDGGNSEKYKIQSNIIREFVLEKLKSSYVNGSSFKTLFNYVSTNFTINDLLKRADAICAFSGKNHIKIQSPENAYSTDENGLCKLKNAQKCN